MSSEIVVAPTKKTRPRARLPLTPLALDVVLVGAFLALVFLLGAFPLKDTDFWWHLRTGDLIRQTGQVPRHDLFTYTAADHRWIDLHWGFQVALSWGFGRGGVVALNLAKCAITCAAVLLLITARRRDWPLWVVLLAWLPALLVLGGRMYIRPETLTLLYLAIVLVILFHWERYPALAFLLPLVQVAWVNSHGLFVLGPLFIAFGLIDALCRPGALAPARKRWWQMVLLASVLMGLACLANPYGLAGALFPLELARTMGNPMFTRAIAELTPIPLFIERSGGGHSLPLQLHLATMGLGALSFLLPLLGALVGWTRAVSDPAEKPARKRRKAASASDTRWRLSPLRLLLFVAFSALSWRATRNSHQFAAVVGTITAWNFAEWAAVLARHAGTGSAAARRRRLPQGLLPRLATLGLICALFVLVASGNFYALAGEGRTVGLGEEPLWFPHAAVEFAGKPELPDRFLSFHEGYAALYEYHNGPQRKVFVDARLEVVGATLYKRYLDLAERIRDDDPGWPAELDAAGRPAVMVGHATNGFGGAVILANPAWHCVWFDPVVAMFVHRSFAEVIAEHEVDFGRRHFAGDPGTDPHGLVELLAASEAHWNYAQALQAHRRPDLARPQVLLGLDYAGRIRQADPASLDGWKLLGKLEMVREPLAADGAPVRRYRLPFDSVHDLSVVRATYDLRRAQELAPQDFLTLFLLRDLYAARGMDEAELSILEQLGRLRPRNDKQAKIIPAAAEQRRQCADRLGPAPPATWENLSDLDRKVVELLAHGRLRTAVELLERAYPGEPRPWEITDRIGTLWMHLGEPVRARAAWENAPAASDAASGRRAARLAATYLVEGDIDTARRHYRAALSAAPDLFEAHYGLAVLEQDAGQAAAALGAARGALSSAPDDVSRSAAGAIANLVRPYAAEPREVAPRPERPKAEIRGVDTPLRRRSF
jgi:tetratricopeptide (TPR) repeat protein